MIQLPAQCSLRAHEALMLISTLISIVSINSLRAEIGDEVAVPDHLSDGREYRLPLTQLIAHGEHLFTAPWTYQEGGGRPLTKGTGSPVVDPDSPLIFPRNFNRLSAPDSNACSGCHNAPRGIAGGGGDFVTNVFVLAQRFDFATFDPFDTTPTRGTVDEQGKNSTLDTIANSRATVGMFGSGYIEMLARQMTEDLQLIRDAIPAGESRDLVSKGVAFGTLGHASDGTWDVTRVVGIPESSLTTSAASPPSLIIRPFHQAGRVVSIREFTNNAFNHHHGIQSTERFGMDMDPDGDQFTNELTRADVTAVSVFQATLAVPGRVIPNDPEIEAAVLKGEELFSSVGCVHCHIPSLPLDRRGWIYSEPNPFNPPGNLRPGDAPTLFVNLSDSRLPSPRLQPNSKRVVEVPAYTDLKLHDLTDGPDDPNREPLNMQVGAATDEFFAGNGSFLTKKLWGAANEPPYFHHGKFATMREAIWAHGGEATAVRQAFWDLSEHGQDCIIEFLKTLQVLPKDSRSLIVDEDGNPKTWPPRPARGGHFWRQMLGKKLPHH